MRKRRFIDIDQEDIDLTVDMQRGIRESDVGEHTPEAVHSPSEDDEDNEEVYPIISEHDIGTNQNDEKAEKDLKVLVAAYLELTNKTSERKSKLIEGSNVGHYELLKEAKELILKIGNDSGTDIIRLCKICERVLEEGKFCSECRRSNDSNISNVVQIYTFDVGKLMSDFVELNLNNLKLSIKEVDAVKCGAKDNDYVDQRFYSHIFNKMSTSEDFRHKKIKLFLQLNFDGFTARNRRSEIWPLFARVLTLDGYSSTLSESILLLGLYSGKGHPTPFHVEKMLERLKRLINGSSTISGFVNNETWRISIEIVNVSADLAACQILFGHLLWMGNHPCPSCLVFTEEAYKRIPLWPADGFEPRQSHELQRKDSWLCLRGFDARFSLREYSPIIELVPLSAITIDHLHVFAHGFLPRLLKAFSKRASFLYIQPNERMKINQWEAKYPSFYGFANQSTEGQNLRTGSEKDLIFLTKLVHITGLSNCVRLPNAVIYLNGISVYVLALRSVPFSIRNAAKIEELGRLLYNQSIIEASPDEGTLKCHLLFCHAVENQLLHGSMFSNSTACFEAANRILVKDNDGDTTRGVESMIVTRWTARRAILQTIKKMSLGGFSQASKILETLNPKTCSKPNINPGMTRSLKFFDEDVWKFVSNNLMCYQTIRVNGRKFTSYYTTYHSNNFACTKNGTVVQLLCFFKRGTTFKAVCCFLEMCEYSGNLTELDFANVTSDMKKCALLSKELGVFGTILLKVRKAGSVNNRHLHIIECDELQWNISYVEEDDYMLVTVFSFSSMHE